MNMDDLSPAFAAESLTLEIIAELKRRLESTGTYNEQLRIVTEMEDKYDLEEGILLSHFFEIHSERSGASSWWLGLRRDFDGTFI